MSGLHPHPGLLENPQRERPGALRGHLGLLPGGAATPFLNSGQTWYQVFWTSPSGGSAFYQLAHHCMAATLNVLNGASTTSAVDDALEMAEDLFDGFGAGPLA